MSAQDFASSIGRSDNLSPTKHVRWIRRGDAVIMQQWYEDPLGPPSLETLRRMGEWKAGEFRDTITPIISDEV